MEQAVLPVLRDQLIVRRHKLESAAATLSARDDVMRLLAEVDAALDRLNAGAFGLCETCGDAIEADRLLADPVTRFCIDHLTRAEQSALEQDLDLAARIQRELLPKPDVRFEGWDLAYHFRPAGPVSGDYYDLIATTDEGQGYFLIGDVAGKGIAAALLMSHLSAMLRTLITLDLPLGQLMERTSRVFCESTLPTSYSTLVCGRTSSSGDVEISNAGHPPPLVIGAGEIVRVDATGLPVGMFCNERFASRTVHLDPGDALLLYTDGLIEARNPEGADYGVDRLCSVARSAPRQPEALIDTCLRDLARFCRASAPTDDLTILVVSRR